MTNESMATRARGFGTGRTVLVALCVAGMILCCFLLQAGTGEAAGWLERVCAPGPHVNCASVLASRWSKIGGVSAALLGMVYFGVLLVWFAAIGIPNRAGRRWHLIPIVTTALGVCFSIYFIGIMATQLGVWCTLCVAVHVVNVLMFAVTVASRPDSAGDQAYLSPTRAGIVLGGSAAAAIVLALGVWSFQLQFAVRRLQTEYLSVVNEPAYIEWRLSLQPVNQIPITADDLILGKSDAKNTVVVFSDFQCSNCRMFDQFAQRMVNLGMPVRVVFKHFPMSRACNPHISETLHSRACNFASAVESARSSARHDLSKMLKFHHRIYDIADASALSTNALMRLANELELDASNIEYNFKSDVVQPKIKADIELGHQLGVEGTPAIFVNGQRVKTSWQIVTNDLHPKLDLAATDSLWRRLLSSEPPTSSSPTVGK
jgi:protein-disulfide isomerase/uncharacterized membrane protein